jgi:hypothetical protein
MTDRASVSMTAIAGLLVALAAVPAAVAQTPPEPFAERLEVRETSVAALPPAGGEPPPAGELRVIVDGLERPVTRVERMLGERRGEWSFVVYLDPRLAGARTRYLAALALAQRAEELSALGSVEVLVAETEQPALERSDSWQRIEAALYQRALEARHRLRLGDAAVVRPSREELRQRLDLLVTELGGRGVTGPCALFLPADGAAEGYDADALAGVARVLAGAGWVTVPMPWSEGPSEGSTERLSDFEQWRESAEGRDTSAGTRRYVIDLGRVVRRLRGVAPPPRSSAPPELAPGLVALEQLAGPTSGRLAAADGELQLALADLARRWRVWFQIDAGGPRPLEVRRGDLRLAAPTWIGVSD